ncbi:response regulator transcription factor [Sphingomonas naphthae]|uniref:Response regulator transcription factor n=1 Tax=Sphingomonas naphthae TaxID=1813468 RepID=A0ABY7THX2_9SPHN|nr:response regulator transcription factor [Sphingomonas naphthae]WCT72826.1 response regulator transcription factor [Sphingomonas naphthae]
MAPMRTLLVEDDRLLGSALKRGLETAGHRVDWVTAGDDLVAASPAEMYDIVLLDLGLEGMPGIEALRILRARHDDTPVIIITAQDRQAQKVAGLDAGADDYLVKPLDLDEVLARIRAQVRRADRRSSDMVVTGDIRLDLTGRVAWRGEERVAITAKEYRLLAMLMRRAGRFVSKADLEAGLYDDETEIESNTIEVAVSALRRKFGKDAILTARGLGYMIPK